MATDPAGWSRMQVAASDRYRPVISFVRTLPNSGLMRLRAKVSLEAAWSRLTRSRRCTHAAEMSTTTTAAATAEMTVRVLFRPDRTPTVRRQTLVATKRASDPAMKFGYGSPHDSDAIHPAVSSSTPATSTE